MTRTQTIVLAGVGDFGRYLYEELLSCNRYDVVVLTRQKRTFDNPKFKVVVTDYSEESVLSILNSTGASVLISTIQCPEDSYIRIHQGFLNACLRSVHCKRFIPSEWAGNIEDYPGLPRAYGKSRAPFRAILQQSHGVEWTLFNHGWFMDYFVPEDKSYMKCTPGEFPFDLKLWRYCVKGTGDEPQSWTCGRDVAKAVTELLTAREWEPVTYVVGQWGTFNEAAKIMENFYGRPFSKTHKSAKEITALLDKDKNDTSDLENALAEAYEWSISGASACPKEKTLRQYQKYFGTVNLLSIEAMLEQVKAGGRL